MESALLGVILLVQGIILYRGWKKPPVFAAHSANSAGATPVSSDAIWTALGVGIQKAGLNIELHHPRTDLLGTNKLAQVLFHASTELGKPIRTVQDLYKLLGG